MCNRPELIYYICCSIVSCLPQNCEMEVVVDVKIQRVGAAQDYSTVQFKCYLQTGSVIKHSKTGLTSSLSRFDLYGRNVWKVRRKSSELQMLLPHSIMLRIVWTFQRFTGCLFVRFMTLRCVGLNSSPIVFLFSIINMCLSPQSTDAQ